MAYNSKRNYQEEIDAAVKKGDYSTAAQLEQGRNEKIAGEGLDYAPTYNYTQYLNDNTFKNSDVGSTKSTGMFDTDYSKQMERSALAGDWESVYSNGTLREGKIDQYNMTPEQYGKTTDQLIQDLYKRYYSPQYEGSKWDETLKKLADEVVNSSYEDWTKGADYQSLAQRYGYLGNQAMQDTLGQISARTGGLASSYAGSAAQQSYNDYMTKLEETAREMYAADRSDMLENASLMRQLSQDDYNMYLNDLNQFNVNRDYGHQIDREEIDDTRYDDETNYDRNRDAISDERYEDETNYNRSRDAISDKLYADETIRNYIAIGLKPEEIPAYLYQMAGTTANDYVDLSGGYSRMLTQQGDGSDGGKSRSSVTSAGRTTSDFIKNEVGTNRDGEEAIAVYGLTKTGWNYITAEQLEKYLANGRVAAQKDSSGKLYYYAI